MPLNRPSLPKLISQTVADIQSRLPGSDPLKRHSLLGALGKAQADALNSLYGLLDYYSRQANPATAEKRYLELWASVWDIKRLTASPATGYVDLTGRPETYVAQGLQMQSSAGVEYVTTESASLDADGQARVAIAAVTAGAETNLPTAALLNLISPAAGVASNAYVSTGDLSGGADLETDARLRARLFQRIQYPPHGGALHDYERWSLEVAGVARVWPISLYDGDGTVRVWIGETGYAGDDLASGSLVDQVQTYIESPDRKPVTAAVTVAAPARAPVDIDIALLPNTAEVKTAVNAELDQLFARDAKPEGKILISRIREAVSIAAGESDNQITAPTADITAAAGQILTKGTVTFS